MVSRKRGRNEMEADEFSSEPTLLMRIRNMWEFASLVQYIYIFGKALKINDDLDVEELEKECLQPTHSTKLTQLGLTLLKFVSSHKGLTEDIFDEYARRQYVAKASQRNPFGTGEIPNTFSSFDTFTKIRVLHQLSTWTLVNPDRIRERMPERDAEQTQWRIEPLGWDAEDRSYFVLDDDRLYRRTDAPLPPPKPKTNSKKAKAARASKRRKTAVAEGAASGDHAQSDEDKEKEDDGFGGMKWECLAITLEDYKSFMETIRSRDPNEKALYARLRDEVLPVIERRAEEQLRQAARKQRELETLQKMATAKRSSRIAGKQERQREMEQAIEQERKRQAEHAMALKEQEKQRKLEEARQYRMMTREQRQRDRERKRILHEEELARLQENSKRLDTNEARISERHLKAELEKRQKALAELTQGDDEQWIFDCSGCGVYGENLDDGSHSVACEQCSVWQHSSCLGIKKDEAARDDFHFICADCKRRIEESQKPKIPPIKIRLGNSLSPKSRVQLSNGKDQHSGTVSTGEFMASALKSAGTPDKVEIPPRQLAVAPEKSFAKALNGDSSSAEQQNGTSLGKQPPKTLTKAQHPQPTMKTQFSPSSNSFVKLKQTGVNSSPGHQKPSAKPKGLTNGNRNISATTSPGLSLGSQASILGQPAQAHYHNPFHNSFARQRPSPSTVAKNSNIGPGQVQTSPGSFSSQQPSVGATSPKNHSPVSLPQDGICATLKHMIGHQHQINQATPNGVAHDLLVTTGSHSDATNNSSLGGSASLGGPSTFSAHNLVNKSSNTQGSNGLQMNGTYGA